MNTTEHPQLLVVDDDPAILQLIDAILKKTDYRWVTCSEPKVALERLSQGSFDLIVTDAIMPEMDGFDFVRELRKSPRQTLTPVLMLTRKRDRQDVKRALDVGVDDYLLKPLDEKLFLEKIDECLRKSTERQSSPEHEAHPEPSTQSAELSFRCEVTKVGDACITLAVPFEINAHVAFFLKSALFQTLGISSAAPLKLLQCEAAAEGFEATFSLSQLKDEELQTVQEWLIRQEALEQSRSG